MFTFLTCGAPIMTGSFGSSTPSPARELEDRLDERYDKDALDPESNENIVERKLAQLEKRTTEVDKTTDYHLVNLSNSAEPGVDNSKALESSGRDSRVVASESKLKLDAVAKGLDLAREHIETTRLKLEKEYVAGLQSEAGTELSDSEKIQVAEHHESLQKSLEGQKNRLAVLEQNRQSAADKTVILYSGSDQAEKAGAASAKTPQ